MKDYEAETEDSTESSMQLGVVYEEFNTCLNTICDTSIQLIYKKICFISSFNCLRHIIIICQPKRRKLNQYDIMCTDETKYTRMLGL